MNNRCDWAGNDPLSIQYHDQEWGVPVYSDRKLFEFLCLEGMQAGLSWLTILRKRQNLAAAFDNFDPGLIARYQEDKLADLMENPGIIRNRRKIQAVINNARTFLNIQEQYGSFSDYIWAFTDHRVITNRWTRIADIPAKTALSAKISSDLKKKGFQFVGPTVIYSHMQATGMVNDHLVSCFRHRELNRQ